MLMLLFRHMSVLGGSVFFFSKECAVFPFVVIFKAAINLFWNPQSFVHSGIVSRYFRCIRRSWIGGCDWERQGIWLNGGYIPCSWQKLGWDHWWIWVKPCHYPEKKQVLHWHWYTFRKMRRESTRFPSQFQFFSRLGIFYIFLACFQSTNASRFQCMDLRKKT